MHGTYLCILILLLTTVVIDYFAWQLFHALATSMHYTNIFRWKFSRILWSRKKGPMGGAHYFALRQGGGWIFVTYRCILPRKAHFHNLQQDIALQHTRPVQCNYSLRLTLRRELSARGPSQLGGIFLE